MPQSKYILLILFVLLMACTTQQADTKKQSTSLPTDSVKAIPPLNPALFPVKNMTSSNLLKVLPRATFDYLDSAHKTPYTLLDSAHVMKYIQPVYPDYAVWFFGQVKLIAWQDKVGDLQPFIVRIDGQDYNGLVYIVLNKNNIPVSKFELTGGSYDMEDDSSFIMHTYVHSKIKNGEIDSYKLYMYQWVGDSVEKPFKFKIDSICRKSVLQPDGTLITTRTDSVHYTRMNCPKYIEVALEQIETD